jgi:hypothetical protein
LALGKIIHNLCNNKKKKMIAKTTFLLLVTTILMFAGVSSTPLAAPTYLLLQSAEAFIDPTANEVAEPRKAPTIVSGDNIYIAWWTNNTSENGNEEIMFRASNDGGATFGDKINLSNTTDADSWRVEVAGEGADVVVSWWEMNQTSDIPVARVSTDGGATFGPLLRLGMNGTIGATGEEGEEGTATFGEEGEG